MLFIWLGRRSRRQILVSLAASLVLLTIGIILVTRSNDPTINGTDKTAELRQADYGDQWPLTLASGTVTCQNLGTVIFSSGGTDYRVFGAVTGFGQPTGQQGIDEILKPGASRELILNVGLRQCSGDDALAATADDAATAACGDLDGITKDGAVPAATAAAIADAAAPTRTDWVKTSANALATAAAAGGDTTAAVTQLRLACKVTAP